MEIVLNQSLFFELHMHSAEIIKNIAQIYTQFKIPPNLQMHQKLVASVAALICDQWKGSLAAYRINRDDLVAFLLIHDLGNIIKYKFDSESAKMLGAEAKNVVYWKRVREEIIQKYGSNVKDASERMMLELDPPQGVRHLFSNMAFAKTDVIARGNDWSVKIAAYCDFRVGPFGVVSLQERLDDLRKRYGGKTHDFDCAGEGAFTKERVDLLYACDSEIETQIMQKLRIAKEDITTQTIQEYFNRF